jgi:hypothetical protein
LDSGTKEFIVSKADPGAVSQLEQKRMRKAVMHHVFGKTFSHKITEMQMV